MKKIRNVYCKHKYDFLYDFWFYIKPIEEHIYDKNKIILFSKTRAKRLRYKLVFFLHCKVTGFQLLTWNFTKTGTS